MGGGFNTGRLQGLDSEKPEVRFTDGTTMEGTYADTLGSQLFFDASREPGSSKLEEKGVKFIGLSEKCIRFRRKQTVTTVPAKPPT